MLNTSSSHFLYVALSITKTKGTHINPKKMYHYYSTDIAILIRANSNNCNIHSSLCTDLQQLIGICFAQNLVINLEQPSTLITY